MKAWIYYFTQFQECFFVTNNETNRVQHTHSLIQHTVYSNIINRKVKSLLWAMTKANLLRQLRQQWNNMLIQSKVVKGILDYNHCWIGNLWQVQLNVFYLVSTEPKCFFEYCIKPTKVIHRGIRVWLYNIRAPTPMWCRWHHTFTLWSNLYWGRINWQTTVYRWKLPPGHCFISEYGCHYSSGFNLRRIMMKYPTSRR